MKKYGWLLVILLIALILGLAYRERSASPGQSRSNTAIKLAKQEQTAGGITVAVTPEDVASGVFMFDLSTHSVELNQDLVQTVTLRDENGRQYRPLQWEGSEPGGHHRQGKLQFGQLEPLPQQLTIIINNLGDNPRWEFIWVTVADE